MYQKVCYTCRNVFLLICCCRRRDIVNSLYVKWNYCTFCCYSYVFCMVSIFEAQIFYEFPRLYHLRNLHFLMNLTPCQKLIPLHPLQYLEKIDEFT